MKRRRRPERALFPLVMEGHVHGGDNGDQVDGLVAVLGVDGGISKSEVSAYTQDPIRS